MYTAQDKSKSSAEIITFRKKAEDNPLNALCQSLSHAVNCNKFKAFPEGYCREYGLSQAQIHAVTDLDIKKMLAEGGNIKCVETLVNIFEMDFEDLCHQQTGLSIQELLETNK